ncbi:hypothetical protein [Streptomyces lunalinharesii]|uniref:Uncharacterized protein n=1 Tax=Streptomyces lunalinharesii TaxID=333384 RepID=A0ABP6ER66_9ACTN
MEWINPKYADIVASLRIAKIAIASEDDRPLRGFLVDPAPEPKQD